MVGPAGLSPRAAIAGLFSGDGPAGIIVRDIRLPRTLLAALIGATLGLSGAALQGLLRNPLAEPALFGAPQAAAAAAALVIAFGFAPVTSFAVPVAGILGATVSIAGLVAIAGRRASLTVTLLAGLGARELRGRRDRADPQPRAESVHRARNRVLAARLAGRPLERSSRSSRRRSCSRAGSCSPAQARAFRALTLGEDAAASLGVDVGAHAHDGGDRRRARRRRRGRGRGRGRFRRAGRAASGAPRGRLRSGARDAAGRARRRRAGARRRYRDPARAVGGRDQARRRHRADRRSDVPLDDLSRAPPARRSARRERALRQSNVTVRLGAREIVRDASLSLQRRRTGRAGRPERRRQDHADARARRSHSGGRRDRARRPAARRADARANARARDRLSAAGPRVSLADVGRVDRHARPRAACRCVLVRDAGRSRRGRARAGDDRDRSLRGARRHDALRRRDARASRSPARSRRRRPCCSPTSRPPRSIRATSSS